MTEAPATRKHGKNAFLFVIVCVAIDMLGFGIIIPVMPSLLMELTGQPASEAVEVGGLIAATFGFLNFLAMPVLGNLSDRYGRRPVLLASIATLGIDFLIMGFAHSLWLLFIGRALSGVSAATFSTANAYIADTTDPDERGRAFGMIGAAFGFGFVIGPAIGGFLGDIDTRLPFFAAGALCFMNFLYGYFVLPESLAEDERRPFKLSRANPFGTFMHFSKLPKVAWFIAAIGLFSIAHSVFPSTWSFHGVIRYGWDDGEIGLSLAFVGIGSAIVQAALIGPFIKRFGPLRTAAFGLAVNMVTFAAFAYADMPWMAYAIIPISSLGGVMIPAINQVTSGLTPRNAQGELHSAVSSLQALTMAFSPILMTQTLHTFSAPDAPVRFPGAAFLLAAMITALAIIPFVLGVRANRREVAKLAPDTGQTPA
ncbi:TCR/Tet family MFS transporter [Henriciella sp.]|uniref:TCR/Tet family MFS transporter n=1 Tax=Henriciella sp. TaxID=1968823 RepID=UPI00260486B5|nr:TCR/Tet family MFS transporter [Henriciella sp.]